MHEDAIIKLENVSTVYEDKRRSIIKGINLTLKQRMLTYENSQTLTQNIEHTVFL